MVISGLADMFSMRELAEAIKARDTGAFEELIGLYQKTVVRRAEIIVRDKQAAEDIAQDVFITVWTKAEQWGGNGSFTAWLFRIAVNLSLNHLRRRDRRKEQPLSYEGDDNDRQDPSWIIDRNAIDPEAAVELLERQEAIMKAVGKLSSEKREVILLANEYELEPKEIAQTLNLPQGTIRSRLYYARKNLRDYLAREDEE